MRTKTLLITAALAAAGVITAMAQDPVYSVNAVGYVNMDIGQEFKIITNPLNVGDNMLSEVLPDVPPGTQVFFFDGVGYTASANVPGVGWLPDAPLAPGDGAFIQAPSDATITFVGEVPQGDLSVDIPAGFSMKGSPVPQEGTLDELAFPGGAGDQVFLFRGGTFASSAFVPGVGWLPNETIGVGEGFFVLPVEAKTWDRTFSVNE